MGAAALQFSMKDKRITSTLCGVTSVQSIEKNLSWAQTSIPDKFWNELLKLPFSTKDPESERIFTPG
jgi:D-threo-aldose 1-dehydrogenase